MTTLEEIANKTRENLKNIKKPLSSYQCYTKVMREKWNKMSEEEKDEYYIMAKNEKMRYENEKKITKTPLSEAILQKNIYLINHYASVPCVGLDNGFDCYNVVGPVQNVEFYSDIEKEKLKQYLNRETTIPMFKSLDGIKFNKKASKKYNVIVYGGNTNNVRSWWSIKENYKGETGKFTTYINYKEETWTEKS